MILLISADYARIKANHPAGRGLVRLEFIEEFDVPAEIYDYQ